MKNLIIASLLVALPCLWILATPNNLDNFMAESTTQAHLDKTRTLIEGFRKQFQRLPNDLNEVRLFALANHRSYSPYDGFSLRLFYQPLGPTHYIIKSFGADNAPNTILSKEDPALFNLGDLPPIPPVYVPPSTDFLQLYPAICLAGCKSPVNDFVAQIEVDRENGRRFLLVRHQSRHKFIMIAPQSRVEEFLWLPTGYEIIYTATGDNQYRDGVFLWNLLTDETRNLLDDVDLGLLNSSSQSEEPKYFLSLAALSSVGRKAYIYIAPRLASELDPGQFFSAASLYAIQLSDKEHPKAIFSHPHPAGPNLFAMQNSLTRDINRGMQGSPLQMRWASLPLDGKMGGLLEAWQDFSMACAESPIFPYSLWWLGFIYSDAYRATFPISQKHALTLKAFGTEIAGALVALNQAPSHLRAMGVYMGNHLRGPSALTYSLVSIAPPTKADLKK